MLQATTTIFRPAPVGWGFHRRRVVRCEDCDLRGDLDLFGRPRFERIPFIKECGGCGGTGTVPAESSTDPMWTGQF